MTSFSPDRLLDTLRAQGLPNDARLYVALSGGVDSTVLLHALARLAIAERAFELRALHVDHQLHPDSAAWGAHCEAMCASLAVPFTSLTVFVQPEGEGLEAAARRVRYEALRRVLRSDEILLTAHHADDQLETVLLGLMRGAGVAGLSGIPADQPFGAGRLLRPLLSFTREQLVAWARAEQLNWIEDPSNANVDHDRNYLRRQVLPALAERWPVASHMAARSASHMAEARRLLGAVAEGDLARLRRGQALDAAGLRALEPERRRNALRRWLHQRGVRMPSTRKLHAIENDLLHARDDKIPAVAWDGVVLRRYRGELHLEARLPRLEPGLALTWNPHEPIELPGAAGSLWMSAEGVGNIAVAKLANTLTIRFRTGGERIKPQGDAHHRDLKKLLQAAGVAPWRRARIPLIYSGDQLVAVGDLWVAAEFAPHNEPAVHIVWDRESR